MSEFKPMSFIGDKLKGKYVLVASQVMRPVYYPDSCCNYIGTLERVITHNGTMTVELTNCRHILSGGRLRLVDLNRAIEIAFSDVDFKCAYDEESERVLLDNISQIVQIPLRIKEVIDKNILKREEEYKNYLECRENRVKFIDTGEEYIQHYKEPGQFVHNVYEKGRPWWRFFNR